MGKRYEYKDFKPVWEQVPPPKGSFREAAKWGDPNEFKEPNERLYKYMKTVFGIGDETFKQKRFEGLEALPESLPVNLGQKHIEALKEIFGEADVSTAVKDRVSVAYGKTMYDAYRLREGILENIADVVVYPSSHDQIVKLVTYANEHKIPLYVYGGGSSVTRGVEAVRGGISLDMRKNFNKVLAFNETDQTITVQAGMSGPQLEAHLNNAQKEFNAKMAYTCGHFPQSFEYSSVGGWVVTRGAGQNSTYYGNIKDIVFQQTYVTPAGIVKSYGLPAHAVGPDIDELMMGSEGSFGILTNVTLRFFKYRPETRKKFSFIFKTWEDGMKACREIMQNESGFPSVFRLSDAEETDMALKLYGVEGTIAETAMNLMGYKPMKRCLFLGWSEGAKEFSKQLYKKVKRICKQNGGLFLTGKPVDGWEHGRFTDPYLRESLQDYGVIIDTMECSVTWDMMPKVHEEVRRFAKSRPHTVCMTHLSHAYPQGANLYFIFIGLFKNKEEYLEYQYGIFDNIMKAGAAMSHHHGVGKMTAAWVEESIGQTNFEIFKALKKHFDPNNIMNPGGTLGLDMPEDQKRKPKYAGKTWEEGV